MLEGERAPLAVEGSSDMLDGHVTGDAFGGVASTKHFALACGFEIAVKLLVEGVAADCRTAGGFVMGERNGFYIEVSGCMEGYGGRPFCEIGCGKDVLEFERLLRFSASQVLRSRRGAPGLLVMENCCIEIVASLTSITAGLLDGGWWLGGDPLFEFGFLERAQFDAAINVFDGVVESYI